MTEETKTEDAPKTDATETKTETKTEKPRPPGYEPVNFDELNLTPEQRAAIEPRIRYLYGNLKKGEAERTELRGYLDKLQKDIDERIKPLETAQTETQEAQLTQAIKLARDEGRVEDELKLTKALHKVTEPKPEPKTEVPQPEFWRPAVESWAAEADHEGKIRRPWLHPEHPEHVQALGLVHKLSQEWQQQGTPVNQSTLPLFLNQLDQRMTKPNGRPAQTVLGTSQIKQPEKKSTDLTQEEKMFADKTMTHVKDPEERYRRYASHRALMRPRP